MANKPHSKDLRVIIIKIETAPGVMEALAASDFDVRVMEDFEFAPDIPNDKIGNVTRNHARNISPAGTRAVKITCRVPVAPGANVTTAPKWFKFAKICGAVQAAYASAGIGIHPRASGDRVTGTVWIADIEQGASPVGVFFKFAGVMGNMKMVAPGIGQTLLTQYEFMGRIHAWNDDATPEDPGALTSPDTEIPYIFQNVALTVGGVTLRAASWELDAGNELAMEHNSAQASGIELYSVAKRSAKFSMNFLKETVANYDILTKVFANTTAAIVMDSTGYAVPWKLTIPKAQIMTPAEEAPGGLMHWKVQFECLQNGEVGAPIDSTLTVEDTWRFLLGATS